LKILIVGKVASVTHWLEDCAAAWRAEGHEVRVAATRNPGVHSSIEALLLSERLGATLPYDTLEQLRAKLYADHPSFGQVDHAPSAAALDLTAVGATGEVSDLAFASPINDFYFTNPIARASVTMAECSASTAAVRGQKIAAE